MASRRTKLIGGIAGGLVLLLVLVVVLVPLLVPREKLRSIAEQRAREMTGGEVSLGELSLSVFPRLKLVLGESTLAVDRQGLIGAGQIPGPLESATAKLGKLEVDLALLPLIQQKVEFGEIRLIAPQVTLVTAPPDEAAPAEVPAIPGAPGATTAPQPGVSLALAAVEVRDGQLTWQESGSERTVTVAGWQQDLSAPMLGAFMQRLQRLSGWELPADREPGDATLDLDTRIGRIELVGFGASPLPALENLHLRGAMTLPPSAEQARISVAELSMAPLAVAAEALWTPAAFRVTEMTITGGEAVELGGTASLVLPPAVGPLTVALDGQVDLSQVLAMAEPWLPEPAADQPPLPTFDGRIDLELSVDLAEAPLLSDAAAWQAAWQAGLDGQVQARVMSGAVTVSTPQLADPLTIESVTITSDLASARGRTRAKVQGLVHPAARADASLDFTLPPAGGALTVEARMSGDLARMMATAEPFLPPRPAGAEPLPELAGEVTAAVAVDLKTAPSLADTAAWRASWARGLDGKAELTARAQRLSVAVPQLGDPLTIAQADLVSDLRSPGGRSELTVQGVEHAITSGRGEMTVIPKAAGGATAVDLRLDRLDLDAMAEIARAQKEAAETQAFGLELVPTARADELEKKAVGELIPPELAVDLDARVKEMIFLKARYSDVEATGTLRERVIDVPQLAARLGTGRLSGTAKLDYGSDPFGRATWSAKVEDAPASALLEPYARGLASIWTGALRADLSGACDLADPEAIRNSLTLEGDVLGTDGMIDLRQSLGGVTRYLGDRQDLLRVVYDGVDQHLKIRDGKVFIEGLKVDGKQTDWTGDGWISLDGEIDMGLHVKLPAGFTPDLGDLSFVAEGLRDENGRIGLDLALTGPAARPAVALDIDPARMLQSEGLKKGLEEEVKKGLGGLLDRLKGK